MTQEYLSIQEAANFLGVSPKTLRRWEAKGILLPVRTPGNQRRYNLLQLKDFHESKESPRTNIQESSSPQESTPLHQEQPLGIKKHTALPDLAEDGENARIFAPPGNTWRRRLKPPKAILIYTLIALCSLTGLFVVLGSRVLRTHRNFSAAQIATNINNTRAYAISIGHAILGASDHKPSFIFNVNVPSTFSGDSLFNKNLTVKGTLTAPNVLYSVKPGTGIQISSGQNPTISSTGVSTFNGQNGDVSIVSDTGLSVATSGAILSLKNTDPGSGQKIFGTLGIDGGQTVSAGSNTDAFKFAAGGGVSLSLANKILTITSVQSASSQWTTTGTDISYTTGNVGIGTSTPGTKLDVNGTARISGAVTLSSFTTGIVHSNGSGVLSSGAVALGSETSGNYVAGVTVGNGLGLTSGAGVGVTPSISINLPTSGTSANTSANSGLEKTASGLSLLRGCGNGQILKWNASTSLWECNNDAGGGGGSTAIINVSGNGFSSNDTSTLNFSNDFSLNENPLAQTNINIDYANSHITRDNQAQTISGLWNFSTTPKFGALGTGIGHLNSSGVFTSSAVGLGSADVTGTLGIGNGGTGQSTTPTNGQVLIGNGSSFSLSTLTAGTGVSVSNGSGVITIANLGVTSITGTANQVIASSSTGGVTLSLPQAIATSSTPTFGGLTLSTLGSGIAHVSSGGVFSSSAIGLASGDVTGTLGITNGGTGITSVSTGDLLYGSGANTLAARAVGSNGQVLTVTSGLPQWVDPSTLSNSYWNQGNGVLSPISSAVDVLIGGSATGSAKFGFLNVTSGTPTASISAGVSGATYLTANGTIGTTAKQSLVIGSATTGNVRINGFGTGVVHTSSAGVLTSGLVSNSDLTNSTIALAADSGLTGSVALGQTLTIAGTNPQGITTSISGSTITISGADATTSTKGVASFASSDFAVSTGAVSLAATGVTNATYGGAGNGVSQVTVDTKGRITAASNRALDLSTSDVTGTLSIGHGGTNTTSIGSAGSVSYSNGSNYAFTAVGTSGYVLKSNGAGAPTWVDSATLGTNYFQRTAGVISPVDIANDFAIGGTATSSALFQVFGTTGNATTSGNLTFGNTAQIQSTSFRTLTLGGNTTGNIVFNSQGNIALTVQGANLVAGGTLTGLTGLASSGTITFSGLSTGVLHANSSGVVSSSTVTNGDLQNSSITVTAGTGLSGGGSVSLGGTVTINNAGVTSIVGGTSGSALTGALALANSTTAGSTVTIDNATSSNKGIASFGTDFTVTTGAVALSTTGVSNNTYGGAGNGVGQFTVDTKGRVTAASNRAIGLSTSDVTGTLPINRGGTNSNAAPTAGGVAYGDGSSYQFTAAGTSGYVLTSAGAGTPTWTDPAAVGTNYWNLLNGTLAPKNNTVDFLVGTQSSASAKFAILNVNSGTPVASVSAGTNGAAYLTADGSLATTAKQSLTLGSATTGNILLNGFGAGVVHTNASGVLSSSVVTNGDLQNSSITVTAGTGLGGGGAVSLGGSVTLTNAGVTSLTGTANQVIVSGSTGSVTLSLPQSIATSSSPSFTGLTVSGLTASKVVFTDGSKNLTSTGTVGVGQGGTGATTLASNGVVYGNGTSAVGATAAGTDGQVLLGVTSGAPAFGTVSGDGTITNAGVFSLKSTGPGAGSLGTTAAQTPVITVDAQGRVTAVTNTNIAIAASQITSGLLSVARGGTNSNAAPTAGGVAYGDGSSYQFTAAGTSGYVLTSAGAGTPTWTDPAAVGTNYWNLLNGTLAPKNNTVDFLVGTQSSASAKFAILNVNSGTPVASVSAGTNGAAYLTADGSLATTAKQSLTLGSATTGNILLNGFGAGVVHTNASGVLSSSVVTNGDLQNSSITVTAGTGLGGGGAVSLGGSVTLTNAGVTSLTGTANQVIVSGSTGSVTLSLPQDIATTSSPTFASLTLAGSAGGLTFSGSGNHDITASSGTLRFGAATLTGAVTGNGQNITGLNNLAAAGTITFSGFSGANNGGALYANSSGVLSQTAAGTAHQLLHGGGAPSFGSLDLTTEVGSSILPIANGGTNNSSAYTLGSVVYSDGTKLTQDNANFFYDATNKRFGIGTNAPIGRLHVTDTGQVALGKAVGVFDQYENQDILTASASGVTKLFLSNTGNIGFTGNTSSLNILSSAATAARTYTFPDATGTVCLTTGNCAGSGGGITGSGTANYISKFTGTGSIGISTIYDNGQVGIGTTTPLGLFNVNGQVTGKALTILNYTGSDQNILTASASGTTVFTIDNTGAIVTGSYKASTIGEIYGGTGKSSYTTGDLLYGSGTNTLGKLAIGSAGKVLTVVGGVPSWQAVSGGSGGLCSDCVITDPSATQTITPTATNAIGLSVAQAASGSVDIFNVTNNGGGTKYLSINSSGNLSVSGTITASNFTTNGGLLYTNGSGVVSQTGAGTSTQVLHGGTSPAYSAVSLTADVTGTLPVGNGGTGATTLASNGVVYGNGTSAVGATAAGTDGQVLLGVTSGAPAFGTVSGDGTITNAGVFSLKSTGPGAGSLGTTAAQTPVITVDAQGRVTAVTNTNIAIAASQITSGLLSVARGGTNSNAAPTAGGVAYGDGSAYQFSVAGSSGQVLVSGGTGAPTWTSAAGVGTNYWNQLNGTLAPLNNTVDFLVGTQSSASAKFAILNVNSGTPVASVSAGTNGAAYLTADGSLATTAKQSLTLGSATTGNILLNGFGAGVVHTNASGVLSSSVVTNGDLQNSSITVTAGTGLGGGGAVSLGGSVTLTNAGVTSLTGTANQVIVSGSTGSVTLSLPQSIATSSSPSFTGLTVSGLTASKVVFTDGSKNLTSTGTVGVGQGGTGATTLASNGVVYGNGTSAVGATAAGTDGQVLLGVTSGAPAFGTVSGDGTITNAGVFSLKSTGPGAGSLGTTAAQTPVITVDAQGRVTAVTNTNIAIAASQITSGLLSVARGGTNSNAAPTAGGVAYGDGSAYQFSVAGSSGQVLVSGGTGAPTWTSAAGVGTNYWNQLNGTLAPLNNTVDFLVGTQSSASAKFAILNVNSGTPVASVSAGTNGAAYLTADGSLATTAKQSLTLGSATTGNILLNGFGAGVVHTNASGVLSSSVVTNGDLQNSSITVTAGTGLGGGGAVSLGGSVTLTNAGVTSLTGTANQVIVSGSTGSVTLSLPQSIATSSSPSFTGLTVSGLTASKVVFTDGSKNLTSTGTVGVGQGGTGATTLASNGVVYGNGTSAVGATAAGTDGQVLLGVTSGAPAFGTVSGDGTITNAGVFSLKSTGPGAGSLGTTAAQTPVITVDAQGRVTAVTNTNIAIAASQITSGLLSVARGGTNSNAAPTAGGVAYGDGSAYQFSVAGSSGQVLVSGGTGAPTWTSAAGVGTNYWNQLNGTLAPLNNTVDFLVGTQSSASAKFAILNVNSGTPVASVSAGTNGAAYLTADGSLATTAKQSLTLGSATTGNILLNGFGAGVVHTNASGVLSSSVVTNGDLQNSSITVTAGTGLGGGGAVSLGGSVTLTNAGVTSLTGTANQVIVSGSTGSVTLSLPQDIATTSSPTFASLTLAGSAGGLTFSGSGNHDITASSGTLRFGAATLTGAVTGNGQNITGLNNLAAAGTITFSGFSGANNGGALYANSSGVLSQTAAGTAHQLLHGGGAPSFGSLDLTTEVGSSILPIANGGTNNSSAYTLGSVVYSDGTKLTQDNANFFYDATNKRFGIGTNAPIGRLHVTDTGQVALGKAVGVFDQYENQDILTASASGTTVLTLTRAGNLNFNQNSQINIAGTMLLDSTGALSINTTNNQAITTGAGATTLGGTLAVNGQTLSTNQTTFNLLNATATTVNFAGAATTLNIGASTGTTSINNATTALGGNLTIAGTTGETYSGNGAGINFTHNSTHIIQASSGTLQLNAVTLGGDITGNAKNVTGLNNLAAAGSITFSGFSGANNGGALYANSSGVLSQTAAGSAHQVLHGGGAPSFSSLDLTTEVGSSILPIANGGTNGTATPTAGGIAYGTGSAYAFSSQGTSGYVLVSGGSGAPSWSPTAALGTNYWNQLNGTIAPLNNTVDLLIGTQATGSAKFAFINVNSGSPTASISGNLALVVPTTANSPANLLNLYNNGSLNIQNSIGGDGGLASALYISSKGNIGIGTTSPTANYLVTAAGSVSIANTGSTPSLNVTGTSASAINAVSNGAGTAVFGSANNTGNAVEGDYNGSSGTGVGVRGFASNGFAGRFDATSGAYALTTSGGNVGIGVTNPAALFSVGASSVFQINSSGVIAAAAGITSSGSINFSGLSTNGLVKTTGGTGTLTVATAGSDYENPLTFSNGLTRTTNAVTLGGTLTGATNIANAGNVFSITGTGNVGIGTNAPGGSLSVSGAGGTLAKPADILQLISTTANNASNWVNQTFYANRAGDIQTPIASISALSTNVGATTYKGELVFSTTTANAAGSVPTEKVRIDSIGNLLFNQSSQINAGGSNTLTLNSGGTGNIQFFSGSNTLTSAGNLTVAGTVNGATISGGSVSGGSLTGGTYANTGFTVTGNYTGTINNTGNFNISDGTNNLFTVTDAGTVGNISNIGTITLPNSNVITGVSNFTQFANGISVGGGTTNGITSAGAATLTGLTSSGTITLSGFSGANNGGVLYANSSGVLSQSAAGTASQCLIGGATPSWATCAAGANGTNYWNQANGATFIGNTTTDLLVGGNATSSAKFAFINVNSGSPTASISGNLALVVPTTANSPANLLNLYNNGSLNIQNSIGGDGGLASALYISSKGNVGIGMTSSVNKLQVLGDVGFGDDSATVGIAVFHPGNNGAQFGLKNDGGNGLFLGHLSGGPSIDETVKYLYAKTTGIGIGTTNPSTDLNVFTSSTDANANSSVDIDGALVRIGDMNAAKTFSNGIGIKFYDQGTSHGSIKYVSSGTVARLDLCQSSNSSGLACDGTPTLSAVLGTGNVGIGNTSATNATLDVTGTGRFSSTLTAASGFTLGSTAVTSTGTQLNYLNAATGTTGTTSTNLVFSTSPSLTTPTIAGGTHTALTSLGIRSTGAAFDLTLASSEVLTAGRTLSFVVGDAARTLDLTGGNLTVSNAAKTLAGAGTTLTYAGNFTTAGAFALTLTSSNTTNATLPPGTITLVDLAATQTLTNKTLTSPVIANIAPGADFTLTQNSVVPFTSVNAGAVANTLYLKAGNVGIGTTAPTSLLNIAGSGGSFTGASPVTPKNLFQLYNNDTATQYNATQMSFLANRPGAIATQLASISAVMTNATATAYTGDLAFSVAGAGAVPTEAMRIVSGGNVGIGNTSATNATLDVTGTGRFSSTLTAASGFTLGSTAVTSTGTQLNYLNAATGTTGTTSTNLVFSTSPSLTTPTIAGGTHTALTSLGIRSTGAAFDLTLASSEVLTAGRTLSFVVGDAARTLDLTGGNLTVSNAAKTLAGAGTTLTYAGNFTTAGAFALTLTSSNTTNATLPPGTITLVDLAATQTLTNKTLTSPVIANIAPGADFTLTQNSVVPFTSVNAGAVANTLYLKAGNVGIGTTAPTSLLNIAGSGGSFTGASPVTPKNLFQLYNNDTATQYNATQMSFLANRPGGIATQLASISAVMTNATATAYTGDLAFSVAGAGAVPTEAMRIVSGGNVGIGITNPGYALQIAGSSGVGIGTAGSVDGLLSFLSSGASISAPTIGTDVSGNLIVKTNQSGATTQVGSGTGNITLSLANQTDLFIADKTLTQTGNYSSTDYTFKRVMTQASTYTSGGTVLLVTDTSGGANTINPDLLTVNAAPTSGTFTGNLLRLQVGGTDKVLVNSNGNMGIGTATPNFKLDVQDSQSASVAAQIYNTNTGTDADGLIIKLGNTSSTVVSSTNHFISFETAGIGIVGSVQGNGNKTINYKAGGIADFAEYLKKDRNEAIPWGAVVCEGSDGNVHQCQNNATNMVGVASEFPTYTGGDDLGNGSITVGLSGVVDTEVSADNGSIQSGDYITVSNTSGVGVKATQAGRVVGKALASYTSAGIGKILVLVQPTWYDPDVYITDTGDVNVIAAQQGMQQLYALQKTSGGTVSRNAEFNQAAIAKLTAGSIDAQAITIGGKSLSQFITDTVGTSGSGNTGSSSADLSGINATLSNHTTQIATLQNQVADLASASAFLTQQLLNNPVSSGSAGFIPGSDLDIHDATVSGILSVLGRTTLGDLGVTGNITDGLLTINGLDGNGNASINTIGDLYLQNNGTGGINILAGKVTIDTSGNIVTSGDITAKNVNADKVNVTVDSTANPPAVLSTSAGVTTLKAGQTSVDVSTSALTGKSLVFTTPDSPVAIGTKKINATTFRISSGSAATTDVKINWWIVN